jgi:hypothetical protein
MQHMHNKLLLSHRNHEILSFMATLMKLEVILLSELCMPGTERQAPCDLTHLWNIKKVDFIEVERRILVTRG